MELITVGESMVAMFSHDRGYLRYQHSFGLTTAGAESNVAIGVSKLGHSVGWISKLGRDEFAEIIRLKVRGEGVDTSKVVIDDTHPTGVMFKQTDAQGNTSVFYYRQNSAASTLTPADLDACYFAQAKIVHVTGITCAISESCCHTVFEAVRLAKEAGALVSFDPNIRLKLWSRDRAKEVLTPLLALSDIVLIGDDEADILLGTRDTDEIITCLRGLGVSKIAVKMGGAGAVVADGEHCYLVPPEPVKVVDTVGAGDAFASGFLTGVLEEQPVEICGRMGAIMGAFAVSSMGDTEGLPARDVFDARLTKQNVIYR